MLFEIIFQWIYCAKTCAMSHVFPPTAGAATVLIGLNYINCGINQCDPLRNASMAASSEGTMYLTLSQLEFDEFFMSGVAMMVQVLMAQPGAVRETVMALAAWEAYRQMTTVFGA